MSIRRLISTGFRGASKGFSLLANAVTDDPTTRSMPGWKRAQGDDRLKYDFPLSPDSLALDVGGYLGDWASILHARHRCRVRLYEPVPDFATLLSDRFSAHDALVVLPYGLGDRTSDTAFSVAGLASSAIAGTASVTARVVDVVEEFARLPEQVALMKINIEGMEYDLLDRMLAQGLMPRVGHFLIQFHAFTPDARNRRQRIHDAMNQTHRLRWDHPFVWEAWEPRAG